ncbi:AsmA family protein [Allosphingosinicella indica]|uniref:AsmA domain-containing protein n=1 Tax=Allosphingosinicella indica TaxID=941907 RepID=A0A1X7G078_9SPHN|nr:AsmA family protein [Allosphingosinicella indica]SMF61755.1 hypothetical protein SAMN06295910_0748 [Allosphingosinicella indica]
MDATLSAPDPAVRHVPRWRRRGDPVEIGLRIAAGIIGAIILVWLILFITKGRFLKPYFERYVAGQTERHVRVAGDFQLYFNPLDVKFLAEGMTISNPEWARRDNFFEAKLIDTDISTWSLLFGAKRRVNWLNLVSGNVDLEWDAKGARNTWTFGEKRGEPLELPLIRRAHIADSGLHYRDPRLQLITDIKFETTRARDTQFESDIRFTGTGSMRAKPFTLTGSMLSPNETVTGGRNRLVMRGEGAGHRLDVSGTLPAATQIEGADLRVAARGPNLAGLFDFLGVAVMDTRAYRLTSSLTKEADRWRFTGLKGTIGTSDLAGAMTISMPEDRVRIDADLRSRVLDIIDAGPFIGYDPERLAAQGAVVQEGGRPRMLPDTPMDISSVRSFDARVVYAANLIRMDGSPISNLGLTLDLNRGLMKISPLTMDVAGGHLASDITIDARRDPLRSDIDARLSPTPMGILLKRFGAEQSGTTGQIKARLNLAGTGNSVRAMLGSSNGRIAFIMPAGTFWTRNIQLSELDIGTFVQKMFEKKLERPVEINCGLIAFTVRNGLAAADPILIDTKKNVITGRGGFSFRTEAIDMAVEADAKTFSVFSGQSPIGVGGYFAAPNIDPISGELLARAGVGLGLGALVSPLAAVVAFVDPGDAEPTNCGPVLAGARTAAQSERDGGKIKGLGNGKAAKVEEPKKKRKKFLGIF